MFHSEIFEVVPYIFLWEGVILQRGITTGDDSPKRNASTGGFRQIVGHIYFWGRLENT